MEGANDRNHDHAKMEGKDIEKEREVSPESSPLKNGIGIQSEDMRRKADEMARLSAVVSPPLYRTTSQRSDRRSLRIKEANREHIRNLSFYNDDENGMKSSLESEGKLEDPACVVDGVGEKMKSESIREGAEDTTSPRRMASPIRILSPAKARVTGSNDSGNQRSLSEVKKDCGGIEGGDREVKELRSRRELVDVEQKMESEKQDDVDRRGVEAMDKKGKKKKRMLTKMNDKKKEGSPKSSPSLPHLRSQSPSFDLSSTSCESLSVPQPTLQPSLSPNQISPGVSSSLSTSNLQSILPSSAVTTSSLSPVSVVLNEKGDDEGGRIEISLKKKGDEEKEAEFNIVGSEMGSVEGEGGDVGKVKEEFRVERGEERKRESEEDGYRSAAPNTKAELKFGRPMTSTLSFPLSILFPSSSFSLFF